MIVHWRELKENMDGELSGEINGGCGMGDAAGVKSVEYMSGSLGLIVAGRLENQANGEHLLLISFIDQRAHHRARHRDMPAGRASVVPAEVDHRSALRGPDHCRWVVGEWVEVDIGVARPEGGQEGLSSGPEVGWEQERQRELVASVVAVVAVAVAVAAGAGAEAEASGVGHHWH